MNIEKWFSSRSLNVLAYQKDILENKLNTIYTNTLPTVLAAAPSAGKTLMSICFLDKFIEDNPDSRVLILTHGTTVLRSQYYNELIKAKPGFIFDQINSAKELILSEAQVVVCLPQTLTRVKNLSFDLIVVDEAHEELQNLLYCFSYSIFAEQCKHCLGFKV